VKKTNKEKLLNVSIRSASYASMSDIDLRVETCRYQMSKASSVNLITTHSHCTLHLLFFRDICWIRCQYHKEYSVFVSKAL